MSPGFVNAVGFIVSLAGLLWLAGVILRRLNKPRPHPLSDRSARGEFRSRNIWP